MEKTPYYAIVTETFPPEINGVALTVRNLCEGLRQQGLRVELVRPRQKDDPAQLVDTLLVPGLALPRYPGLQFGLPARQRLLRQWRQQPPAALYVATEGPLGWSAVSVARKLGIPVATGLHTRFDEYMRDYGLPWLEPLAFRWMRHFHNRAANTVVPTEELAQWLRQRGFNRVSRLARAVNAQRFSPARRDPALRQQWGVTEQQLVVTYMGRIAAEKNLPLAVQAFRAIQAQHPNARFVWIGDGPARASLENANPDFIFTGMQLGDELARHLASTDLFLFPSKSETFGNVTVEALASGVPTVAFDYGAAREHLRHDQFGYTVSSDADFIAAALRLASHPQRPEMGKAAHQAMTALRPQQVAERFLALLVSTGKPTSDAPIRHSTRPGSGATAPLSRKP